MQVPEKITYSPLALPNFTVDGSIGTAATTVDLVSHISITQSTANRILTLPNPTISESGTFLTVTNNGVTPFTIQTVTLPIGGHAMFMWNGSTWKVPTIETVVPSPDSIHPNLETLSPFATTGSTHNMPLPTNQGYRYFGGGSASWTGLVAGAAGRKLTIWNMSGSDLHLKNEDTQSIAVNRFRGWDNNDISIRKNGVVVIQYSSVSSRWICVSSSRVN